MTATHGEQATRPLRPWLNWILAILTVPAAAIVMIFAIAGVMSVAGCTQPSCESAPNGLLFTTLFYGAPVVAVLTIAVSFVTARRPRGIVVPLVGLGLLAIDLVVLALMF